MTEDVPPLRMRVWTFGEDATTLCVSRYPGVHGANFIFMPEGDPDSELESVCRAEVDGVGAQVERRRYVGEDSVLYGVVVEMILAAGEGLAAAALAPSRAEREDLLALILRMRVDVV